MRRIKPADGVSCTFPDRDVPKLVCGHPLPCPYHTLVIAEKDLPALIERRLPSSRMTPLSYIGG